MSKTICIRCGPYDHSSCGYVRGLCHVCGDGLEKEAKSRGFSLKKPPILAENDERTLKGTQLWFWRGQWRALLP